jgi:hypothetical protein
VPHAGRGEGRAPAALVVARKLEVEALARHADGNSADARQESFSLVTFLMIRGRRSLTGLRQFALIAPRQRLRFQSE